MSQTTEYIKHRLVCSPVGGLLDAVRGLANRSRALKHPELKRLLHEDAAIDKMFKLILKPTMNCVDCGCHIGSVMTVFHKLCPQGRHVGVEALPHKAQWLRERFPKATIHQVAVGDSDGEVTFHFDTQASARSSMHKNDAIKQAQSLTVKLKRLDDLLGLNTDRGGGNRVDFLKVDVEGAELFAFRGAKGIIARDKPPVFFECAPATLKPFNISTFDVFDFFTSINYNVFVPDEWIVSRDNTTPLSRDAFDKAQHYPPIARNFLAMPAHTRG